MANINEIMSFLAELKAPKKTSMQDLMDYYIRTHLMVEQKRLMKATTNHQDFEERWKDLYLPIMKLVDNSAKILGFETAWKNDGLLNLNCTKDHTSKTCQITEQITITVLDTNPKDEPDALFKDDECEDFSILGFGHYVYLNGIEGNDKITELFTSHGYEPWESTYFYKSYINKGIGVLEAVLKPGMEIFDELGIYTD